MKNGKKFLFVMAASVLALITGCQNNSSSTSSSSEIVTSSQVTTSEVSTSEASSTTSETPTTSEVSSSVEESTASSEVTSNSSSETSSSEEHVHAYGNWEIVKKPTLTETGTAKRTCECNDVDVTGIPALSDTTVWSIKSTTPADHFKDGVTIYESVYGEVTVTSLKGEHDFGAWNIVTKPTLTTGGKAERVCSSDGFKEEVDLPVLSDTTVWSVKSEEPATHFADGTKVYTSKYGEVTVVLPKVSHTYGSWTITIEPTETVGGKAKHVCSSDDFEETIDIPALSDASVWKVESFPGATHADEGKNVYTSIYGKVEIKIPAGEHVYGAWTITTAPTATATGKAEKACTVTGCTHIEEVTLPALSDTTVWTAVVTKPTHTEAGYTTYTSKYGVVVVEGEPALDHSYGDPVYEFNSDKTKCTVTRTCVYDSTHIITKTVDVKVSVVPPTRNAEGTATYFADFDDERFENKTVVETIPMLQEYEGTYYVTEISAKMSVDGNNKKIEINDDSVVITTLKYDGSTAIYAEGKITNYNATTGVITFVTEATDTTQSKTYKLVYNKDNDAILCNVDFNKDVVGDDVYFGFNGVTLNNSNVKHSSFPIADRWDYSIKLIEVTIGETKSTYLYNGKDNSLIADVSFSSLSGDFVIGVTEDYKDIEIKDVNGDTLFAKYYDNNSYVMVDLDSAYGKYTYETEEWRFNGAGIVFSGEKEGTYTIKEQCTEVYLDGSYYEVTFDGNNMNVTKPMVTITYDFDEEKASLSSSSGQFNKNIVASLPSGEDFEEAVGYKFVGWYLDESFETVVPSDFKPTENCTIYAKFDNSVEVVLSIDGVETNYSVVYGNKITDLETYVVPAKEGYLFAGWKLGELDFNTDNPITSPVTLLASWSEAPWVGKTFNVNANANYANSKNIGTISSSTITIVFDTYGLGEATGATSAPFASGAYKYIRVSNYNPETGTFVWKLYKEDGSVYSTVYSGYFDSTNGFGVLNTASSDYVGGSNGTVVLLPITYSDDVKVDYCTFESYSPYGRTYTYINGANSKTYLFVNKKIFVDVVYKTNDGTLIDTKDLHSSEVTKVYSGDSLVTVLVKNQSNYIVEADSSYGEYLVDDKTLTLNGAGKAVFDGKTGTYSKNDDETVDVYIDDSYYLVTLNKELHTAVMDKVMVTISFDCGGVTTIEDTSANKNIAFNLEDGAPVEGYIFNGWYSDSAFTNKITSITPTESVTVYAEYVSNVGLTKETAVTMDLEKGITGCSTISMAKDYFIKFVVDKTDSYYLKATNVSYSKGVSHNSNNYFRYDILNDEGETVKSGISAGELTRVTLSAGTYYIKANLSGNNTSTYSIWGTFDFKPVITFDQDDANEAVEYAFDTELSIAANTFVDDNETRVYYFTPTSSGTFKTYFNSSSYAYVKIYENALSSSSISISRGEPKAVAYEVGKTYYLVFGLNDKKTEFSEFKITNYAEGEIKEKAIAYTIGNTQETTLSASSRLFYYTFTLTEKTLVNFSMVSEASGDKAKVKIYKDSSSSALKTYPVNTGDYYDPKYEKSGLFTLEAGTYIVEVGYTSSQSTYYPVSFKFEKPSEGSIKQLPIAVTLVSDTNIENITTVNTSGTWYKFTSGDAAKSLTLTASSSSVELVIYDSTGAKELLKGTKELSGIISAKTTYLLSVKDTTDGELTIEVKLGDLEKVSQAGSYVGYNLYSTGNDTKESSNLTSKLSISDYGEVTKGTTAFGYLSQGENGVFTANGSYFYYNESLGVVWTAYGNGKTSVESDTYFYVLKDTVKKLDVVRYGSNIDGSKYTFVMKITYNDDTVRYCAGFNNVIYEDIQIDGTTFDELTKDTKGITIKDKNGSEIFSK